MNVAVYARKSTEQDVANEAKSVTRQIEHARAYALRKGWTVNEACIFVDDGISGAEFAKRPGFLRLMNALKPQPPFQVLLMSEESRLGREMVQTMAALQQLISAGVRVFYYLDDKERTLDSPIEKAMMALETFGAELEREKNRQRMVDTMLRKARAGHVPGGRCFGYTNVRVNSHVEQRINEPEASVVRRIFELAAAGYGQPRIAKMLNAEGALTPRAQQGRPCAWVQSSVHAVLFRPRYRGESVWNRTRKRDRWGAHHQTDRDPREWISVPAPHLRIVSEELWQAAHARIAAQRSVTNIRSSRDRESQYLLSGLARCAWCNGGMHVRKRTRSSGKHEYFYACTSHFNRGESVCGNLVQVPMQAIDDKVIGGITNLLRPELVEVIVARVRESLQPDYQARLREQLAQQLTEVDRQAANVADAIAIGGDVPALLSKLQMLQQRRAELLQQQEALGDAPLVPRVDLRLMERRARALLQDWRGLLTRHTTDARPVLRQLLKGPMTFTPIIKGTCRGFQFEGAVSPGEILAGYVGNDIGVPGQN